MADDFDAAGISWWSTTARTSSSITSFEGSAAIAAESASCSAAIADVGSSISGPLIDSSPPLQVPGFGMDWNQSLLSSSSSSGGRAHEPSFHAMLQESLSCPQVQTQDQFLIDHGQQQPGLSMMLQGLFETEVKPQTQQSIFDQRPLNYQPPPTMTMTGTSNFSQFLKSSPPKQQASVCSSGHLQFSNNTTFWNASAGAASEARSGFYPSMMPVQFGSSTTATSQSYEQKPSCSSLTTTTTTTKSSSDSVQKRSSSGSSNPALKKSRIEAPSPLPTFKVRGLDLMVRKEKLGDRITALQQLVSPFGKTDTASVLHEAIEYIKFLHDQVSVLSAPYLKNGHPMQHQQSSDKSKDGEGQMQDLRSRGLCLVPIESTYPVASETTADFWTLTFGGSYR